MKFDSLFKKIFTGLVTLAIMLVVILSIHLFFDEPILSKRLWVGSILGYLAVNIFSDVRKIWLKLVVLLIGIVIMTLFFRSITKSPESRQGRDIRAFCLAPMDCNTSEHIYCVPSIAQGQTTASDC